jgi:cell filamentation protein
LDEVGVLNEEEDYTKVRKLLDMPESQVKKESNEVVSGTTQFKFLAPDVKMRLADKLDSDSVISLANKILFYH